MPTQIRPLGSNEPDRVGRRVQVQRNAKLGTSSRTAAAACATAQAETEFYLENGYVQPVPPCKPLS